MQLLHMVDFCKPNIRIPIHGSQMDTKVYLFMHKLLVWVFVCMYVWEWLKLTDACWCGWSTAGYSYYSGECGYSSGNSGSSDIIINITSSCSNRRGWSTAGHSYYSDGCGYSDIIINITSSCSSRSGCCRYSCWKILINIQ